MNFKELRATNVQRCVSHTGFNHALDGWSVGEWGCAAAGEMGEACNIAKKILRVRDSITGNKQTEMELRKKLALELADTVLYIDLWAASQGIDLEEAVKQAFNSKSVEIGSMYRL
jgi:NTP pyrophosphatase (non-canonical NTP hydrolase)